MRFLVYLAAAATAAGHQALLQTGALPQHGAHAEGGHLGLLQNRRLKPGSVPHDVQRHAAAGLEVLWQPHAVDGAAAESEAEPFSYPAIVFSSVEEAGGGCTPPGRPTFCL